MICLSARPLSVLARLMLAMGLLVIAFSWFADYASAAAARGEGNALLKGSLVENVHFEMSRNDPRLLVAVNFIITTTYPLRDVRISLMGEGLWYSCDLREDSNRWMARCDLMAGPPLRVRDLRVLHVVTVQ